MKPICLVQWFHARAPDPERMIERAFNGIPKELQPDVETIAAWNKSDFAAGIRSWMANNTNTQHLITVSHGILDPKTRVANGIGSAPERPDCSIGDDEWIAWDELYTLIHEAPSIPPHLSLVGCKTAAAATRLSGRLNGNEIRAPYLVSVDVVLDRVMMRNAGYRFAQTLLANTRKWMSIEKEFEAIQSEFPNSAIHYPVTFIPGQARRYVNVAAFEEEVGMTLREYLDNVNRVMSGRIVRWPPTAG